MHRFRALDTTIFPALSEISTGQPKPTQHAQQEYQQLMDYAATYPNTIVRHHDSIMVLHVDSDAAYLAWPKARSIIAGCFQLSNHPKCNDPPFLNGDMLVVCKVLHRVVSSAAESENAAVF